MNNIDVKEVSMTLEELQQFHDIRRMSEYTQLMVKYSMSPFEVYSKYDTLPSGKVIPRKEPLEATTENIQKAAALFLRLNNYVTQLAYKGFDIVKKIKTV